MSFEELMEKNGFIAYSFKGTSMLPLLKQEKDIVVIKKQDTDVFHEFDIVLFRRNLAENRKEYVLHRIIKDNNDGTYWIIGDNTMAGETVKKEDILGTLKSIKRNNKTLKLDSSLYKAYVYTWCKHYKIRIFLTKIKNKLVLWAK